MGLDELNLDSARLTIQSKSSLFVQLYCTKPCSPYSDENEENWIPHDPKEVANVEVNWEEVNSNQRFDQWCDDETESKWKLLRQPALPDAVFEDVDYAPKSGKRLAEKFKESGLQIIVKIASIELTPDKPEFPTGGWHVRNTSFPSIIEQ